MNSTSCPSAIELRNFLSGNLPLAKVDLLAPHIENCASCLAELAQLETASRGASESPGSATPSVEDSTIAAAGRVSPDADATSMANAEAFWSSLSQSRLFAPSELATLRRQVERQLGAHASPSSISHALIQLGKLTRYQSVLLFQGQGAQLVIGEYELLEPIGEGGMGQVFRAKQRRLNRTVAVKMILSGHFASAEEVQRFYSEAQAAAQLEHVGIVPVFEVNEFEGRHYYSMAYIEGKSLQDLISKGPLKPAEAAELIRQIADAVHYAHSRGVIHRDLKPRNILVSQAGRPMVLDFGLAKRMNADSDLTHTGQILGTPSYMPPEQAAGKVRQIGPASDVYSLGAVFYTLLCGRPPFQSESTIETIKQVLERPPAAPRLLNASIPLDLETICLKCLEKSPGNRFSSAAELAAELDRFLHGEPIHSRPISTLQRAFRWCSRNSSLVGVSLLLFLLCLAGGATAYFRTQLQAENQINRLAHEIRQQLAAFEAEPSLELLLNIDNQLKQLRERRPPLAKVAQSDVNQVLASFLQRRAQGTPLESAELSNFEPFLTYLSLHDRQQSSELQTLLRSRVSDWRQVAAWTMGQSQLPPALNVPQVQLQDGQLVCTPTILPSFGKAVCLLKSSSQGRGDIEVTFAPGWERSLPIGLVVDGQQGRGYILLVRSETEVASAPLTLQLVRQETVLARQQLTRDNGQEVPLKLLLRRVGDHLSWQVNDGPLEHFHDPFAEPILSSSQFGIAAAKPLPIDSLTLRTQQQAPRTTPLETANEMFHAGNFGGAVRVLTQYGTQEISDEERKQALYKQAICELALQQKEVAVKHLEQLLSGNEGNWPVLAGCQLWLLKLQENDSKGAQEVYAALSAQPEFSRVVKVVPADVRQRIIQALAPQRLVLSTLRVYSEQDIRQLEQAAAVCELLEGHDKETRTVMFHLMRAYMYADRLPEALKWSQLIQDRFPAQPDFRNYIRLLRWTNQQAKAKAVLDEAIAQPDAGSQLYFYYLSRARLHHDRGEWWQTRNDLEDALRAGTQKNTHWDLVPVYLMLGALHEERGNLLAAQKVWQTGYAGAKDHSKSLPDDTRFPQTIMLGVLGGTATDEELRAIAFRMVEPKYVAMLGPAAQIAITKEKIGRILKNVFTRTQSAEHAREAFIWETTTLQARTKALVVLSVAEFICQEAFGGEPNPSQEQLARQVAEGVYRTTVLEHKLDITLGGKMLLHWMGTPLGSFDEIIASLPTEARQAARCVMAYRLLSLSQREAARTHFSQALQDSGVAQQVARQALDLLEKEAGVLQVDNRSAYPVDLVLKRKGEHDSQTITLVAAVQMDHEQPAGEYEVSLKSPNDELRLSTSDITLRSGQFEQLRIDWRYEPSPSPPLAGLLIHPARLPDGRRWQVDTRLPRDSWYSASWSKEGNVLIGSAGGTIREVDPNTGELVRIFPGLTSAVHSLTADPLSGMIAAAAYSREVALYHPDGKTLRLDMLNSSSRGMQWNSQQQLAVVGWLKSWQVVDSAGGLGQQREMPENISAFCWGPDSESATLVYDRRRVVVWNAARGPSLFYTAQQPIEQLEWNSSRDLLALHLGNKTVSIINDQGKAVTEIIPQQKNLIAVVWDPARPQLLLRYGGGIEIWSAAGELQKSIPATGFNKVVKFHSDGRFCTLRDDRGLDIGTIDGDLEQVLTTSHCNLRSGRWLDRGRFAWIGDGNRVHVCTSDYALQKSWSVTGNPTSLAWNSSRQQMGVATLKEIVLCHPDEGVQSRFSIGHNLTALIASPDGKSWCSGSENGEVVILDSETGEITASTNVGGKVAALDWNGRNRQIAIGSANGKIHLWEPQTNLLKPVGPTGLRLHQLAWSPDGQTLVTLDNGSSLIFRKTTGEPTGTKFDVPNDVYAMQWLDDQRFVCGTQAGDLFLLDRRGNKLARWKQVSGGIHLIDFDPASGTLLCGGRMVLSQWNLANEKPLNSATILSGSPLSFAVFSPGGQPVQLPAKAENLLIYYVEDDAGSLQYFTPAGFQDFLRETYSSP